MHPRDYALFELGDWDNLSGVITAAPTLVRVCHMHELVARDEDRRQPELELVTPETALNALGKAS